MKKHKDTKEIESTMIRVSKVQREMELSEYNRKGILKTLRKVQKPSEVWGKFCEKRKNDFRSFKCNQGLCNRCQSKWMDKHCTLNDDTGTPTLDGIERKARRMK